MKIAYLSVSWFADIDFSIIHAMKTKVDPHYFLVVTPYSLKSTSVNIEKQYPVHGIFRANIYPEIEKFSGFIDMEKTYIVNLCHNKIKNAFVIVKLLHLLLKMKLDALHTTFYYPVIMFPLLALCKKTFLTVHDPIPHSDVTGGKDSLYRKVMFAFIKNIILLNKSQELEFIRKYKLQDKNIHISKLGVYDYLHIYGNTMSLAVDANKKYILFFGRITKYKGLDYLMPAMKIVNQTHGNIRLVVAGSCKNYYFDISEYEDCPYIEIRNRFIPDDELAPLIKNSLFVVCPYVDATQSGVVMSAFALNVPVLATDTGGLPEYVEHMKSGYIVPPKDTNALADGIKFLLDNEGVLEKQRKYIMERYETGENSWDKITDDIIRFYEVCR